MGAAGDSDTSAVLRLMGAHKVFPEAGESFSFPLLVYSARVSSLQKEI